MSGPFLAAASTEAYVDPGRQERSQESQLLRMDHFKRQQPKAFAPLGREMIGFFKQSVQKRQTRFSQIAQVVGQLVPDALLQHCSLEAFSRGTLTILVDSSPHLYELKQLLMAGLQQQILLACGSTGLRKITLKPGRWYEKDDPVRPRFDR